MKPALHLFPLPLALLLAAPLHAADGPLQVNRLSGDAPSIDGQADPLWSSIPATRINIAPIPQAIIAANKSHQKGKYAKNWAKNKSTAIDHVELKAAHDGTHIYIMARWPDGSKDDQHKPYVWSGSKDDGEYTSGKEREDRLSFRFPISGTFSYNMLAGKESSTDVWQWKAARSNPSALIHDKHHIYSNTKPKGKSSLHYTADGKPTYVSRISDAGGSPYKSQKIDPFTHKGASVPKYVPKAVSGDAADVKAKGVWEDGYWTVEIQRKLDTGNHSSDTVFSLGSSTQFAVAAFDHVGDHFHSTSKEVEMVLAK